MHDDLNCQVCMNLVNDPKQCAFCDKLYCSKCIQHWLKQNQNCPNCKEPFVSYPRINKIILNALSETPQKRGGTEQKVLPSISSPSKSSPVRSPRFVCIYACSVPGCGEEGFLDLEELRKHWN